MPTFTLTTTLRSLLQRELAAVRRSVEAYPDDRSLWIHPQGLPNAGGTIALHVAGNLQHFFGARLGQTGYVRNRDAEFAKRDVPRKEILAQLDAAALAVDAGMKAATPERLSTAYPEPLAGQSVMTGDFLVHLLSHLAYHLGQLDYHRRMVVGENTSINALAVKELTPV
jgi:hypothetical protein